MLAYKTEFKTHTHTHTHTHTELTLLSWVSRGSQELKKKLLDTLLTDSRRAWPTPGARRPELAGWRRRGQGARWWTPLLPPHPRPRHQQGLGRAHPLLWKRSLTQFSFTSKRLYSSWTLEDYWNHLAYFSPASSMGKDRWGEGDSIKS